MFLTPIQTVLKEAGVISSTKPKIADILDSRGLTLEHTVDCLMDTLNCPDNNVKLRSTEMSFKLHGVLRDEAPAPPTITFIIQGENGKVANILTPR